jgi:hypothetical protein
VNLPQEWRAMPVPQDGGIEVRRLANDDHPFGGVAVPGNADQCHAAALMIEGYGRDFRAIKPLRRRPRRGDA